jgi:tetratricopeptide (TPR) repeat protein
MNRCYLLPILLIFLATASAQSPADSLLQVLSGKSGKDRVSFINGHFYEFYSQDFNVAIRLVEEAKTLAMQNNWQPEVAASEKNLGIIHYLKGNYEKALEAYHAALSLYEKTGDDAGRGFTLKELGNYYKKQKQYDTALQKLAEGLLACKAAGNEQCHAEVLDIQGVTLLEMGKLNEAEAVFEKEKEVLHTLHNERSMSYVLDHLSEVAILRGQHERALVLLQESNALRQKVGDAHGIAININNMGEVMLQAGLPERAVPFFTEAVQRSTAIGFHDLRRHAMQQLSEAHAGSGQAALAIQWLQKSVALKDSMFNEERSRQIAEMSAKYETEKKELELVRQSQRLQRRGMWLAIAVALLAILTAFFTSVLRKQKQKQREIELKAELASSAAANRLQEERLRISRDLHDNLGAELSIIGSNLSRKAFHSFVLA